MQGEIRVFVTSGTIAQWYFAQQVSCLSLPRGLSRVADACLTSEKLRGTGSTVRLDEGPRPEPDCSATASVVSPAKQAAAAHAARQHPHQGQGLLHHCMVEA